MIEAILIAGAVGALFGALAHKGWLLLERMPSNLHTHTALTDKDD